jgi:acyl-CoA-dependent ceramide synthase
LLEGFEDEDMEQDLTMIFIGLSINILLLLALTHAFFPRARRRTRTLFEMSYYDEATGTYTQGYDDLNFAFTWLVIFIGLRVAVMEYVLKPFAKANGIKSKKGLVRFTEQGWLLLYYAASWLLGMVSIAFTFATC